MFSCMCRRRKKRCQVGVEPGDEQSTRPKKSVNVEVDQKQETLVPDTPATSATTVSVPAEAPKEKTRKASWWRKLLRCRKKIRPQTVKEDVTEDTNLPSSTTENRVDTIKEPEGGEAGVQEASPTPDTPNSAATEPQPEKDDVSTSVDTINESDDEGTGVWDASLEELRSLSQVETDDGVETCYPSETDTPRRLPTDLPVSRQSTPVGHGGSHQAEPDNISLLASGDQFLSASASTETLSREELIEDKQRTRPQKSVNVEVDQKQETLVPNTPATSATTVSAPAEAPKEKTRKASWWRKLLRCRNKIKPQTVKEDVAEDTNLPSSTTENRFDTIKEPDDKGTGVQEASPTPDTPNSAATEPQPEKVDVSTSVDTINESDEEGAGVQEASPTPDTPNSAATVPQPEKDDVSTSVDTINESDDEGAGVQEASPTPDTPNSAATVPQPKKDDVPTSVDTINESDDKGAGVQEASSTPDTPNSAATVPQPEKDDVPTSVDTINESDDEGTGVWDTSLEELRSLSQVETDDGVETCYPSETDTPRRLPTDLPVSRQSTPVGHGGSQQVEPDNISLLASGDQFLSASASTETLSREELVCLGLPNLAQTCYMNSTLQGLLTLTPFVQEVYSQQKVWSSHPSSQFLREFVDIAVCRFSNNKAEKKSVLAAFKNTIAEFNSEFDDDSQKDAHEFLSCLLDMLSSLYIDLHTAAVEMGLSYTCPVNAHIAFQMLSTRTCKGCGMQSIRHEDNMNLFLDLVPGGSVSKSLQDYLKESSLEYQCECGAKESSHRHSFLNLPNVLILQLQRFRFTSSFNLKKVNRPIILSRELVMNPELGITEQTRYSLVSIISHLGSTAHSGHYICDGSYRQQKPGDVTDRWLTYNDNDISEATGESVCQHRQRTAYLLFYEKQ